MFARLSLLILLFLSSDLFAQESSSFPENFELDGLEQFVSEQAAPILAGELEGRLHSWIAEISAKEGNKITKEALREKLKEKLKAWLPKAAKKIVEEKILAGSPELKEVEEEIVAALNRSLNETTDRWLQKGYVEAMHRLFPFAQELGKTIGQATVSGFQKQIKKVTAEFKNYLPTAQFAKIKEKVMGIPLVDLPNQVYGGILAASAAMHLAKFSTSCSGFFATCNWNELKRFKEVTETMIWQLKNKESVTLNLGDFVQMVKQLGDQLGSFHWGALPQIAKWNPANQFLEKLNWFEGTLKKIDTLYDEATGKVLGGFDKAIAEIETELKKFSGDLLGPLKMKLPCLVETDCPEMMMSPTFPKLFGEFGEKIPLKEINDAVSGALADAAVKVAEMLKITGPTAEIKESEKIPPQNASFDSDFDPVFLHNGEFYYTVTDLTLPVPASKNDFQFTRIYRSRSEFLGALGWHGTHNFAEHLWPNLAGEKPGITYISPEGKKYFFLFEAPSRFVPPDGLLVALTQNGDGFVLRYPDGEEHFFDKEGRLVSLRDTDGQTQHCIYNDNGQLVRVDDTRGRPFFFHYLKSGLLEKVEDFTGRTWAFQYNDKAELIAATSPGTPSFPKGKTTRYRYDEAHRMILVMDPKGQIYLQNFYAESGGDVGKIIAQQYGEDSHLIEARYDGLNTWVKDRAGVIHLYRHDEEGHLKSVIPAKAGIQLSSKILDPDWSRPRTAIRGRDDEKYEYDPWGNIISATDADGHVRKFEVDASNLITKEIFNGEERFYYYDANDNIIKIDVPSRRLELAFEYDMLDRLIAKKEIFEKGGEAAGPVRFDPIGRPVTINNAKLEWDDRGRLISITDEKGDATRYSYDASDRLVSEKYPNGTETTYRYDKKDQLIEMADRRGILHHFEYDKRGNLVSRQSGETKQYFKYDRFDRIIEAADNAVRVQFVYDAASRVIAEAINGRWVYKSYDAKGNKTRIEYPSGLQVVREYGADNDLNAIFADQKRIPFFAENLENEGPAGKLLPVSPDKGSPRTTISRPPHFERDLAGNLIRDDQFVYEYDALNRLIRVRDLENRLLVQYVYDPFGRLVSREVPSEKKRATFIYDDWNEIEMFRENAVDRSVVFGSDIDRPLMLKTADSRFYFYHLDLQGSVQYLTDADGEKISPVENHLGFIGRPVDPVTGLVNLRYRYYSPKLGEFITPDPLGFKNEFYAASRIFTPRNFSYHNGQGGAGRTTRPNFVRDGDKIKLLDIDLFYATPNALTFVPEMNLHLYAGGDPENFYDPLGLYKIEVQLPHYGPKPANNFRNQHGILMLRKDDGFPLVGPFRVLGRSSDVWMKGGKPVFNKNKPRNPALRYGDTPTGSYRVGEIRRRADIARFGPHPAIQMIPVRGEALKAARNGRENLLIHGGRDGRKTVFGDNLVPTQGCIRMHDNDLENLIAEINRLKKEENDAQGTIAVSEYTYSFPYRPEGRGGVAADR